MKYPNTKWKVDEKFKGTFSHFFEVRNCFQTAAWKYNNGLVRGKKTPNREMETESKHVTTNLKNLGTLFKMRPLRDVAPWSIPPPSPPSLCPSILVTICKPLDFSDASIYKAPCLRSIRSWVGIKFFLYPVLDSIVKVVLRYRSLLRASPHLTYIPFSLV